ncbi:hypothetical protein IWQ62_004984, partial [Dispira parvispora]
MEYTYDFTASEEAKPTLTSDLLGLVNGYHQEQQEDEQYYSDLQESGQGFLGNSRFLSQAAEHPNPAYRAY